jgi:hypothetical protein
MHVKKKSIPLKYFFQAANHQKTGPTGPKYDCLIVTDLFQTPIASKDPGPKDSALSSPRRNVYGPTVFISDLKGSKVS